MPMYVVSVESIFSVRRSIDQLTGRQLPPAFFQVDGLDPLRDEGLLYADILSEEYGIKTKVNVYPGLPHGHW